MEHQFCQARSFTAVKPPVTSCTLISMAPQYYAALVSIEVRAEPRCPQRALDTYPQAETTFIQSPEARVRDQFGGGSQMVLRPVTKL
eukprot:2684943-Pyramimonas_sp.AAC.1